MRIDTKVQLIAGAILAACLALSGALAAAVSAVSGRAQLVYTDIAEKGERPEVALGVAMGAFRGLFVNVLWLRAENMKREGKFQEAVALRRAITRLEPHFPDVWAFQAWDLAYNISVQMPTAQERWQWVKAGMDLLRSQAIPRNPHDTLLHRELAWIFVHKMQGRSDDAHAYYKRQHAKEWTIVLGPPPLAAKPSDEDVQRILARLQRAASDADSDQTRPTQSDAGGSDSDWLAPADTPTVRTAIREADIERRVRLLDRIANAPNTLQEVIAQQPLVEELVRRLRDEAGVEPGFELLRLVEMQRALAMTRIEFMRSEVSDLSFNLRERERNLAFERLLNEESRLQPAWVALLPYVRKRVLIDKYNMELPRMIRYTREFGPLDWRVPAAHAIYWASRGVEEGLKRVNSADFDLVNTDRLVLHGVQEMFRWGDVYYNMLDDTYIAQPNLDFIDSYSKALAVLNKRAVQKFEGEQRSFSLYVLGYHNFLEDVIRILYRMGELDAARRYFDYLRTTTHRNTTDTVLQLARQSNTLDDFVNLDLQDRIVVPEFALTEIDATLHAAWVRGLLRGDQELFNRQIEYASRVHQKYMEEQNRTTAADPNANRMGAGVMPPMFIDVAVNSFVDLLVSGAVGQVQSHLVWLRAPLGLRQASYDLLVKILKPREPEFDRLYPEPAGMDEYRQARAQLDQSDPEAAKALIQFAPR